MGIVAAPPHLRPSSSRSAGSDVDSSMSGTGADAGKSARTLSPGFSRRSCATRLGKMSFAHSTTSSATAGFCNPKLTAQESEASRSISSASRTAKNFE